MSGRIYTLSCGCTFDLPADPPLPLRTRNCDHGNHLEIDKPLNEDTER